MTEQSLVRTTVDARTAVLTIDHPPANALSVAVLEALRDALSAALVDPDVKVIVLTGAGRFFCAGADIRELSELYDCHSARSFAEQGQALCNAIAETDKPVIAAINGRMVLGGGHEVAMACHIRLAEESTEFGNPEVLLGLPVGWGATQRLPRLVGEGRAIEMLLTGERISARQAEAWGLVNRVVPDGTALTEALALASRLARLSGPVMAGMLRAVRTGERLGLDQGLKAEAESFGLLCENDDWREGTRAFLEKRPPTFRDR
jgi:enoyl-CoA hydratase